MTEPITQPMTFETQFLIDPLHPSLIGHFPGNPIVPGVVILTEVLESIQHSLAKPWVLSQVPVVKFHAPLLPNESVQLTFELLPHHIVTFSCQVGSRRIVSGQFIFQSNAQASLHHE